MIMGLAVLRYLPDSPAEANWLTPDERACLLNKIAEERESTNSHDPGVWQVLRNGSVWLVGLSMLLGTTGSYGLQLWLPQIVKKLAGRSDLTTALLSSLPYVAAPFAMVLIGRSSDKMRERCLHAAVPSFVAAAALALAAYSSSPAVAIAAFTIAAAGMYGRIGPIFALPTLLFDGASAAAAIALINTLGAIGAFIGPYVVGIAKQTTGTYVGPLSFLAGAVFFSGTLMFGVRANSALRRWRHEPAPMVIR